MDDIFHIVLHQSVKKLHYLNTYGASIYRKERLYARGEKSKNMEVSIGDSQSINVHMFIIIGFQQQDRQSSQNLNNDSFCRLPIVSAHCEIGTEKYPDVGILPNYKDDEILEGYDQIKETFKASTKVGFLQPYKSYKEFRSSINNNDIGYLFYVFDIRYQKNFTSSQSIKVEFKSDHKGVVLENINEYVLVLTNKLFYISSDGQRYFDLI